MTIADLEQELADSRRELDRAGAALRGKHKGSVEAGELAKLARKVRPLKLGPWASTETRFYGSDGVIAFARPNADVFDIWLGAKERLRFEPLEGLVRAWPDVRF